MVGLEVVIPESERTPLEEDSNYISELIGCAVYDGDTLVGTVADVQFALTPDGGRRLADAAPLLELLGIDGDEVLIPFARAYLVSLNAAAKTLHMRLPPGLIDINRPS